LIIERYLFKELAGTVVAVTLVLFLIFVSSWFARLLGQVVSGAVQTNMLFELLFYMSVETLMLLLPLALFLSVLLTFGRLYKDSEMTAMLACGVSMFRVTRLVFLLALGFAVIIAGISLYIGPWAKGERYKLQEVMGATAGIEAVAAGQFRELADGKLVFYAERVSDDGAFMKNVFIQGVREGRLNLVVADQARQVGGPQGARYLSLINGSRYEGSPGDKDFRIINFAEHKILLQEAEVALKVNKTSALPTSVLLASHNLRQIAELQWRIAMPLSALLLAVLAVYLGRTTPRQGRYARFFLGILVYMGYSNLIGMAQTWVEDGQVNPQIGVWWVHLLLLLIIAVMAIRQAGGLRVLFGDKQISRSAPA
jgi:lipopolysaccharide export system permease protein